MTNIMSGFGGLTGGATSGLGSWGAALNGAGSLLGGIGSIYGGLQQSKIAKDMYNLERTSYLDRKKAEDERLASLGSFGSGLYGA